MPTKEIQTEQIKPSSYSAILSRLNAAADAYSGLGVDGLYNAFARAGLGLANQPQIQNRRIKGLPSLPADYTKEQIAEFLRSPYTSERELKATSQTLTFTSYSYFKTIKTYADIPTYRYYAKPLYLTPEQAKTETFKREATLIDKFNKTFRPDVFAHEATGQALRLGKVAYVPRYSIDKSHNKINYAFAQMLPSDYTMIIGQNNISKWTISFNMMYFLQPGTDVTSFGDLFTPYLNDFNAMFEAPKAKKQAVYASLKSKVGNVDFYFDKVKPNAEGNPRVFRQNGEWFYWVSLPVDRVWVYEIDDASPAVVSPLAGLFLTFAQQGDYEAAQLSLILNPLVKIFTGEIPYFDQTGTTTEDGFRLSMGGRAMFEQYFNLLMSANNTGGVGLYTAPLENIKSHDFSAAANSNDIAKSFVQYGMEKAGLSGIIPVDDDVKAGQAELSAKLESRFCNCIYRQLEAMLNTIYQSMNLSTEWELKMFGSIYTDDKTREEANKAIANGDISAHYILAALDGISLTDRIGMMHVVKESGILDMLIPPITSYTAKQEASGLPPQGGRPQNDHTTEGSEKSADSGKIE